MDFPPELLKKVKLLEIQTRKMVNSLFVGEYHSAFKGQGMTFSEFREYVPGDDVRAIDWNLYARFRKPFVRLFHAEAELSFTILLDISHSMRYGAPDKLMYAKRLVSEGHSQAQAEQV